MVYAQLAQDPNPKIRLTISHSIHEAFLACEPDEDKSFLREAVNHLLVTADESEQLSALIPHLSTMIEHYSNQT